MWPSLAAAAATATASVAATAAASKIDREALPSPFSAGALEEEVYVAPRTATEQALAAVWQEVLGVDRVGIHDNFFNMGGHSLLSIQLIARIKDRLDIILRPREILLNNLEQLAEHCDNEASKNDGFQKGPGEH